MGYSPFSRARLRRVVLALFSLACFMIIVLPSGSALFAPVQASAAYIAEDIDEDGEIAPGQPAGWDRVDGSAAGIDTHPSTPNDEQRIAAATDCLGWSTRRIRYTSDGVIHLEGCGQIFTLTQVAEALRDPSKLELVDPENRIWFLKVNLKVEEGAQLHVIGGSGDARWLRLRSDDTGAVWLRAENGTLAFDSTRVTSWDATRNTFDTDYEVKPDGSGGRAYIAARSVLTKGRQTAAPTACSVNGGTREPYEATMNVFNSEIAHLGYNAPESYGLIWKVYYKPSATDPNDTPPPGRQLYEKVDIFGNVTGSAFHHNYFGAYTFGGYCMNWTNNLFEHNIQYGLDPHDDSDSLVISNNRFFDNGNHGVICSVYCSKIVITHNQSARNRHGIMIHRRVDQALIENNVVNDNREAGIAIFDSHNAIVRNNTVRNSGTAAVRLSVGSSGNLIEENTLIGLDANGVGSGYIVYTYQGSDAPTEPGDGQPKHNTFRNNQMTGYKTPVLKIDDAPTNLFESNAVSGPNVGFEFEYGTGNIVAGTQFSASLVTHVNTIGLSSSPISTIVRNSEIGTTITIKHDQYSSTQLEDTRHLTWALPETGMPTNAGKSASTLMLNTTNSGTKEVVTTIDLAVTPGAGTVAVAPTTWQTSAPFSKSWTETSSTATGAVAHRVGNLPAGECFTVAANSTTLGQFTANNAGQINFSYTGGYSSPISFTVFKAASCPNQPLPNYFYLPIIRP